MFSRTNAVAHLTASSWNVNHSRTKLLMIYHNIYDSCSWTGGHADGERNLLKVAQAEADDKELLVHKPGENSDVKWFELDDAIQASSEVWLKK